MGKLKKAAIRSAIGNRARAEISSTPVLSSEIPNKRFLVVSDLEISGEKRDRENPLCCVRAACSIMRSTGS